MLFCKGQAEKHNALVYGQNVECFRGGHILEEPNDISQRPREHKLQ